MENENRQLTWTEYMEFWKSRCENPHFARALKHSSLKLDGWKENERKRKRIRDKPDYTIIWTVESEYPPYTLEDLERWKRENPLPEETDTEE